MVPGFVSRLFRFVSFLMVISSKSGYAVLILTSFRVVWNLTIAWWECSVEPCTNCFTDHTLLSVDKLPIALHKDADLNRSRTNTD